MKFWLGCYLIASWLAIGVCFIDKLENWNVKCHGKSMSNSEKWGELAIWPAAILIATPWALFDGIFIHSSIVCETGYEVPK